MQRRLSLTTSRQTEVKEGAYTTSTKHPAGPLASLQRANETNMSGATLTGGPGTTTPPRAHLPDSESPNHSALSSSHSSFVEKDKDPKRYDEKAINQGMDEMHDAAKLIRKIDLRLVPGLALLYLLLFLCRQNIGNAKTFHLQEDLNMTSGQYQWALTVFFFTYSTFDIPCNMALKALKPHIWLPIVTIASGIVGTCMGVVTSPGGLIATRTILGMVECGLFPGVTYTITTWYVKREAQFRQALFFGAAR